MNRGNIRAEGRLYELKALQDARKAPEYLQLARTLPGYGDVVFPHCACDSRKEGHVVPAVGELEIIINLLSDCFQLLKCCCFYNASLLVIYMIKLLI